jgi:hypothetical protein
MEPDDEDPVDTPKSAKKVKGWTDEEIKLICDLKERGLPWAYLLLRITLTTVKSPSISLDAPRKQSQMHGVWNERQSRKLLPLKRFAKITALTVGWGVEESYGELWEWVEESYGELWEWVEEGYGGLCEA